MADLLLWAFQHGVALGLIAFTLAVPVALFGIVYLWTLNGARFIAAVWVWRRVRHWWRTGRTDGAGAAPLTIPGGGGPLERVHRVHGSTAWTQQRGRVLRRDGHRCPACGGRRGLEAHHTWYASPIRDTPDGAIRTLCSGCHAQAHGWG